MQFVREYGLVPNRDDQSRYAVVVSYEAEVRDDRVVRLVPVQREWRFLDTGGEWRWMCVRVTELRRWPVNQGVRQRLEESEEVRRFRIWSVRRAVHVDPEKGLALPSWR